jgi:hypothetical protein
MEEKKHKVLGFTKTELFKQLIGRPGDSARIAQTQTALLDLIIEDAGEALIKNSEASNKLASRVLWLNVVMTAATIVGAAFAGLQWWRLIQGH